MDTHVTELDEDSFTRTALESDTPTLVDFTATWCPPCRAIAPHVAAVAAAHAGKLHVGKVDTDAHPRLAERFDVRAMPTLLLFKKGRVIGQIVGAVPRAKIEALVAQAL